MSTTTEYSGTPPNTINSLIPKSQISMQHWCHSLKCGVQNVVVSFPVLIPQLSSPRVYNSFKLLSSLNAVQRRLGEATLSTRGGRKLAISGACGIAISAT